MLEINTNNYFYSYVVDIINTKRYKSKQITPKKHINIYWIILTLSKHFPKIKKSIKYPY